jgi:predicted transposase/invertase (TIGR01784 family)
MNQDDLLWKGIIEDMPVFFVELFLPDAAQVLDLDRGFEFLDKELEELFPEETAKHPRFVDKLLKAYTKDGREEWILIHIEVQGYRDKDFARRMFTYFYRLLDRYNKPVTALAIFTDDKKNFRPNSFEYHFLGTSQVYTFNTYKVIDQDETLLANHSNPFAMVVLTVLLAIKNKKGSDETLINLKLKLFRMLISRQMEKSTMRALLTFLKLYVHFANPDSYRIFEQETLLITNDITTMGIEQLVLKRERQEGREEGIEKGINLKARETAKKLIIRGFENEEIAEITGLTVDEVEAIRKVMN